MKNKEIAIDLNGPNYFYTDTAIPASRVTNICVLIEFTNKCASIGNATIGRPGWSVLVLFVVEPGLANGLLTL